MKKGKILLYAFLFFLGAAIIGILLMWLPKLWEFDGTPDGWLGYWGGVIGALFGVIGAYLVMNKQLEMERSKEKNYSLEKERPYFFIEPSDPTHLNFYFYNGNNSLVTDLNVFVKVNNGLNEVRPEYIKYAAGHCKSNVVYSFEDKCGVFIEEGVILRGKTLLGENFIFIYGTFPNGKSYNGCGFIYNPKSKSRIVMYFGEDMDSKEFENLLDLVENTEVSPETVFTSFKKL